MANNFLWNLRDFSTWNQVHGNPEGTLDNTRLVTGNAREIIADTIEILTYRCRTAYHENFMIKGTIDGLDNKVIGRGITLNSIPDYKRLGFTESQGKRISDELEYLWRRWCERHEFYELQSLAYKGSKISGDSLILLDYYNNEIAPRVVEGNIINPITDQPKNLFNGVYTHSNGRERALNLHYLDKGEPVRKDLLRYGQRSKRLNWILYLKKERPQQLRGMGTAYPILEIANSFSKFLTYEVTAAKINASLVGWLKSSTATAEGVMTTEESETLNNDNEQYTENGKRQVNIQPGLITTLEPDEEIQMIDQKRPSSTVPMMWQTQIEIIAMNVNLPPEIVAKKFVSSYSASRASLLEASGVYDKERTHFNRKVNDPIFREFVKTLIMTNKLDLPREIRTSEDIDNLARAQWQGEPYRSIDPMKEVKAYGEMVKQDFISRGEVSQLLTGETYDVTLSKIKKSDDMLSKIRKNKKEDGTMPNQMQPPAPDQMQPTTPKEASNGK